MTAESTSQGLAESAWQRATRDIRERDRQRAAVVGLSLSAIVAALVVFVPAEASVGIRALAAGIATVAGPLAAYASFLTFRLLRAPFVQRDEARAVIESQREAAQRPDLRRFIEDFEGFVRISEASLPQLDFTISFQLDRSDQARAQGERQRASDAARREALAEYRRLYRSRAVEILESSQPSGFARLHRSSALAPESIWDLRNLADALGRLSAGTQEVLKERIRCAEDLAARYRSDEFPGSNAYLAWETQTRTILGEQSSSWQNEFSARPQLELSPYGGLSEALSRRIASILDDDLSLLLRLAERQGSEDAIRVA